MSEQTTVKVDTKAGAPFVRNYSVLEMIDDGPDNYIHLQYDEHRNPDYIRISARNRHPDKAIRAYFYKLHDQCGHFISDVKPGGTIEACLKPCETTVIGFEEKKCNPRLFLFNAFFVDNHRDAARQAL